MAVKHVAHPNPPVDRALAKKYFDDLAKRSGGVLQMIYFDPKRAHSRPDGQPC